jgi:putative Mn2+ efflux pump MntP
MGVALAMDACAVGMTDGMSDSKMPLKQVLLIALFFGFFQFLMPLIGYFITGIVANAFLDTFEKISAWISFALLAFLGGRMIFECVSEWVAKKKQNNVCQTCFSDTDSVKTSDTGTCLTEKMEKKSFSIEKLFLQAIATSIDALAVGVTLQMAAISPEGLSLGVWGATLLIGGTTFLLSVCAVYIGKFIGDKLADKAEFLGGVVLVAIGIKLLIEGLL